MAKEEIKRNIEIQKLEEEQILEEMNHIREYFTHHTCNNCILDRQKICRGTFKCPAYWEIERRKETRT